jgi:hypothetical protein
MTGLGILPRPIKLKGLLMILEEIRKAKEKYKAAELEFGEAVKRAFPLGCRVAVEHGRGVVRGKVIGHVVSGNSVGYVRFINECTGVNRSLFGGSSHTPMKRLDTEKMPNVK